MMVGYRPETLHLKWRYMNIGNISKSIVDAVKCRTAAAPLEYVAGTSEKAFA
jgi:hypothetical protein